MTETVDHTPGPWVFDCGTGKITAAPMEEGEPRQLIATVRPACYTHRLEADALLIASAPYLADRISALQSQNKKLREALEKLADDYEAIMGDGITTATAPTLLLAARAALREAEEGKANG